MYAPRSTEDDNGWWQPTYKVRVRGTMYLWGSQGIKRDLHFDKPLLLHLHNDVFGEPVEIGMLVSKGKQSDLGTLQPGESVTVQVQGISGVFATCALESAVSCLIAQST